MSIDWSVVKVSHVIEACSQYDTGKRFPSRPALNTFLVSGGKRYPAKFIRGLAFELATGHKLNPNVDYSGGKQTLNFFKQIGLTVKYDEGKSFSQFPMGNSAPKRFGGVTTSSKKSRSGSVHQKMALLRLLRHHFGIVKVEAQFEWLIVPESNSMDRELKVILEALVSYRGHKNFFRPGSSLRCDYYVPSENLIIEYDERQHFTVPREISLSLYPNNLKLAFNLQTWRDDCTAIKAGDNDRKRLDRDEQRAFYDSLRDILSERRGLCIIRLKHGNHDWTSDEAQMMLQDELSIL